MKFITLFFLFFLFMAFAGGKEIVNDEQALGNYYSQLFIGQHQTDNYSGPLNPLSRFNNEHVQLVFMDDMYKEQFLQHELQPELFELKDFWSSKLTDQSSCPNVTLGEHLDYIRYLYRLTTISYLFESLKIQYRVNAQLGGDKNQCSIAFDKVFGKCNPKTSDMKKFKERAFGKFTNEYSKISYDALFKSEIVGWLTLFKRSTPETMDPTFKRLHTNCQNTGKDCSKLTLAEIKTTLGSFCEQDRDFIQNICNEKDTLYGMSYIEKSSELILKSNAFSLLNGGGMGENCLRRYSKVFAFKETHDTDLANLYPVIYKYLISENSRYPQGDLFLPGALKEFDNKGLSDFLNALKPPAPVVVVVAPKIKKVPLPVKKIEVEKIIVKPVEVKPEPVVVVVEEAPIVQISEFERALKEQQDKNLEKVALNMDIFQNDFEFTTKMISELSIPLRKFQTRKALNDMKNFDKLGTKEVPLALIFLKFLIDTDNHQGLYNVMAELTDKFYIRNDLEGKKNSVFVELKNDSSTKNKWQLIILRPQVKPEAIKTK
jgi:hypothetical protein